VGNWDYGIGEEHDERILVDRGRDRVLGGAMGMKRTEKISL